MAKARSYIDKRVRETAIEKIRAQHVLQAMKAHGFKKEVTEAFINARFGGDFENAKRARKGKKYDDKRAHVERDNMARYAPRSIEDQALKDGNPYIKRTAAYRANCKHKFKNITDEWKQCKFCAWCKPRIPEDQMLALPPILEGRELPPLSEDQQWINMRKVHTLAGFVLGKRVRAKQVQYSFINDPYIMRYGIEVKFKKIGWHTAGIFLETQWYKLLPVLQEVGDKNPKKLWRAIQKVLGHGWFPPWQPPVRNVPLAERMAMYRCGDCRFGHNNPGMCSHHIRLASKYGSPERNP